MIDKVHELIEKAAQTDDAAKAINFAQAACNAANALRALEGLETKKK